MTSPFYEAWAELNELDESLGIEPVSWPSECSSLSDRGMYYSCSMRKPCDYCTMVKKHGHPPGRRRLLLRRERRWS